MGVWKTALLTLIAVFALSGLAFGAIGATTLDETIGDANGDNLLEALPGDERVVRTDLGVAAVGGREGRRQSRVFFGQLTDKHVIDEESPARVEFLDRFGGPFTAAYRPQEGVSPLVVNEMVRQMKAAKSTVDGRGLDVVMTTGDNSDNAQQNEARWFIDLLDGVSIDPDSGVPTAACKHTGNGRYDGVRGGGQYYEPDSSTGEDGPGYSPNDAQNPRSSSVRDFPNLLEAENLPFPATGLGVPWYGIFGNHDALVQGNQGRNPALDAVAMGCLKATSPSPAAAAGIAELAVGGFTDAELGPAMKLVTDDLASRKAGDAGTRVVPPDSKRHLLTKAEYIQEHLAPDRQTDGHGFGKENVASGQGNYALTPKPGVRFLVLDSINETGGPNGNIDDEQFRWLHRQILEAESRRELVMVFAHHSLRTMNQSPVSGFTAGDQGGTIDPDPHYGLGSGSSTAPCKSADPQTEPGRQETLRCLFLRHRGVIGFVNGHEHNDRVDPFPRRADEGFTDGGGFWELNTASHIDWPQQSRLIDLFDNRDGTLSIFGTILDHAGPARPDPGQPLPTNRDLRQDEVTNLASISRELAFNDPDADNGKDNTPDKRGTAKDRNVELLVKDPYASSGTAESGGSTGGGAEPSPNATDQGAGPGAGTVLGAGAPCLPSALTVGRRGIGRVRLGQRAADAIRVAGASPRRGRRTLSWCVRGGGRLSVVLDGRGRVRLVASTAPGHEARGVGQGSSRRWLQRRYPRLRRQGGLAVVRRPAPLVFGQGRRRVRYVAIADRRLARSPRGLRAALGRAGL